MRRIERGRLNEEQRALASKYFRYAYKAMYKIVVRLDTPLTDEIETATVLALHDAVLSYDRTKGEKIEHLISCIVWRDIIEAIHRKKSVKAFAIEGMERCQDSFQGFEAVEARDFAEEAIKGTIGDRSIEAVKLMFLDGLDVTEAAQRMNVRKSRISKIRSNLINRLKQKLWEDS